MSVTGRRLQRLVPTAVLAMGFLVGSPDVFADDAACIAASDREIALRKAGKLQESLKELATCSDAACSPVIRTECTKRIAQLRAALPTLLLRAKDAAGNPLAQVTVTLDGAPFTDSLDGQALPAVPGSHKLHFEVAGQPPEDRAIV